MQNRTLIIIILTLSLFHSYAETPIDDIGNQIIEKNYSSSPEDFYSEGVLLLGEEEFPFQIYSEKNRYFTNLSIQIEDEILRTKADEIIDIYQYNNRKTTGIFPIKNSSIPLEILNYPLRNREYTVIEKSIVYRYKNLKSNKLLIKDKQVKPVIIAKEDTELEDEAELNKNSKLEGSDVPQNKEVLAQEKPIIEKEVESKFGPNKYEKLIYTIADGSNIILRKEFYLKDSDRDPQYIYEVNSINYIDGYYVATEWTLTNKDSDKITFKYNIETIKYDKDEVPNKFEKLTSFYGVR